MPSTREEFLPLAQALRPSDTIAVEVSTSAQAVVSLLTFNSSASVLLSNPLQTKLIASAKVKTDKVDARVLAELARVNYLPTVWIPEADTLRLRHFCTEREALVSHRTAFKNQVHSILHRNLVTYEFSALFGSEGLLWLTKLLQGTALDAYEAERVQFYLAEIKRQDTLVTDLDQTIAACVSSRPLWRQQMHLLLSIPGVSLASGAVILTAIGDITRFSSPARLAAYFGLTPKIYQSGEKRFHGRISKQGNAYGRFMLIESAEHLRRSSPTFRHQYERIKKKKNHNVAVVAVARKLATLLHTMLVRNEEFSYAPPRLTDDKRARFKQMASVKLKTKLERKPTNRVLYGTPLRGKKIREDLHDRACNQVAAINEWLWQGQCLAAISPTGFDPRKPRFTDWNHLLELIAKDYQPEKVTSRGKPELVPASQP